MEGLRQLVQSLVVIVMLAVFLELLLPGNFLQGYIKMIMGLLVIVAVLQLIVPYSQGEFDLKVPVVDVPPQGGIEKVQADAHELTASYRGKAMEAYRQGIARQVKSLAALDDHFTVSNVKVQINGAPGENNGKIEEITLEVKSATATKSDIQSVKTVKVLNESGGAPENKKKKSLSSEQQAEIEKLNQMISGFYNLPKEKVKVIYHE